MKKIFEENFKNGEEENSQLCVFVGGTKVIDLYGTAVGDKSYGADTMTVFLCCLSATIVMINLVFENNFDQCHSNDKT